MAYMWLNPEDSGHYAYTEIYSASSEAEADRAVALSDLRYDHSTAHRAWAIDLRDPKHVKDASDFIAECTESLEELT